MSVLMKLFDALGWLWCIPHEEDKNPTFSKFLKRKIPIFWVMGPPHCGKTATATELSEITNYNLIKVSQLIKQVVDKGGYDASIINEFIESSGMVADEIVIKLIINDILNTFDRSIGYIIDGFPIDLRQAKLFIQHFCKPSIIIFVCLLERDFVPRIERQDIDVPRAVKINNEWMTKLNAVYRNYERKTLKIVTNKPVQVVCENVVDYLNTHYGYSL